MMSDGSTSDRASKIDLDVGATHRRAPETEENQWRDDLALCQACARGESGAWDAFFRRHRSFLMHVALKVCRNPAAAEELVSQVTVTLLEKNKLARYSGQGSFQGWLRAVVVHLFLDERRRARRRATDPLTDDQLRQLAATPAENDCRRHFQPPLLAECARHLYRNLRRLPADKAGFMNLYYFQRMTLAEAAAALDIHESTASRWNAKITRKLQQDLVRFMRRQYGWSPAEVYDFLEKCLEFISEQLEKFRRQTEKEEKVQESDRGTSN
jgi:RNA polymerase sigma-70 factor (ECF subfamily)